jgi:hypothetical protein
LALALGMTVSELERSMPATELVEWVEFYGVEPFGDFRADLRSAIVATTIARTMGGNRKVRPIDFMPFNDERTQRNAARAAATSEAAAVSDAFLKASSKLPHKVIRLDRARKGKHGLAR